jgi:hypothetical protein
LDLDGAKKKAELIHGNNGKKALMEEIKWR